MPAGPQIKSENKCYGLLRQEQVGEFNKMAAAGEAGDLTNCDFRGLDLRQLEADGIDFSGCYFRSSDLRGIDFSGARLDGASLHAARIAGVLFPPEFSPAEIQMSRELGTRLRREQNS